MALACYSMVAFTLATGRPARARALAWASAAAVTVLAGAPAVYLGANWLTDVLGGYALGATWVAVSLTADVLTAPRGRQRAATSQPPAGPGPPRQPSRGQAPGPAQAAGVARQPPWRPGPARQDGADRDGARRSGFAC
jgi:hypothetical protein